MSRRIPDPAALIAGVAFTGIGLAFLVGEVELASRARWVWPIVLVSLGAGILAAVLRRPADEDGTGTTGSRPGDTSPLTGGAWSAEPSGAEPPREPAAAAVASPSDEVPPPAPEPEDRAEATDIWPEAEVQPEVADRTDGTDVLSEAEERPGAEGWPGTEAEPDTEVRPEVEERPGTEIEPDTEVQPEVEAAEERPPSVRSTPSAEDEDVTREGQGRAGTPPAGA
jgi:hypothetical protein